MLRSISDLIRCVGLQEDLGMNEIQIFNIYFLDTINSQSVEDGSFSF